MTLHVSAALLVTCSIFLVSRLDAVHSTSLLAHTPLRYCTVTDISMHGVCASFNLMQVQAVEVGLP
jgi:hypothetical protein